MAAMMSNRARRRASTAQGAHGPLGAMVLLVTSLALMTTSVGLLWTIIR